MLISAKKSLSRLITNEEKKYRRLKENVRMKNRQEVCMKKID